MSRRYGPEDPESYERAGRRSRPRTKRRPRYDDAVAAVVITVDRGRFTCLLADGTPLTAVKARSLGRQGVVVGDRVRLTGDVSGAEGTLARLVIVEPRSSVLRRTADDIDPVERVIVANADQLVIVTALADPEPRPRLIDRALVAAYDAGLAPLLCLTKADLAPPDALLALYTPLGVPVVVTDKHSSLTSLQAKLRGRTSVLIGHSGVGKSTLVNRLVPTAERATGAVNVVTGRGRHTSTALYMVELPAGGYIIDTPGIRSFGLAHVDSERVLAAFTDLHVYTNACARGCSHAEDVAECGLQSAPAALAGRVASFRRLMASHTSAEH